MDTRAYLKVSAINLSFLMVGILIGPPIVNAGRSIFGGVAHAQAKDTPAAKIDLAKSAAQESCDESHFECVTVGISSGSAAFGTILANRMASDQLMVNGFDPLKLHDATLKALQEKGILKAADVRVIVDAGRVAKPLRLRPNIP